MGMIRIKLLMLCCMLAACKDAREPEPLVRDVLHPPDGAATYQKSCSDGACHGSDGRQNFPRISPGSFTSGIVLRALAVIPQMQALQGTLSHAEVDAVVGWLNQRQPAVAPEAAPTETETPEP